jgi:hypothetical protein
MGNGARVPPGGPATICGRKSRDDPSRGVVAGSATWGHPTLGVHLLFLLLLRVLTRIVLFVRIRTKWCGDCSVFVAISTREVGCFRRVRRWYYGQRKPVLTRWRF